eukprot:scaffold80_cov106-Isochrysis_galbana.AAC.2
MGDPALYPEIRTARFLYAMQWLPPDLRADYQARQQWIDNNMSYLPRRRRLQLCRELRPRRQIPRKGGNYIRKRGRTITRAYYSRERHDRRLPPSTRRHKIGLFTPGTHYSH